MSLSIRLNLLLLILLTTTPSWSATLESPARGALLSGLGFISGWKCNANHITVQINGGASIPVAMHQPRADTQTACGGTTDNGFVAQMNWALLGDGTHTITAYDDDAQFASVTFEVVTFNREVVQGAHGVFAMPNFPHSGDVTHFGWNESTQHLEIVAHQPAPRRARLEPMHPARMDGRYPTRHVIHGFDVWVSPTVTESPDYTPAVLEQELNIVRAQLLWLTSHDAIPPAAIQQIIDSDVSIILDTPSNPSAWWNCAEGEWAVGCYSPGWNRVGIPIVDAPFDRYSYLQKGHVTQSILLHEIAHAFHWEVIYRGFDNVCLTRHFERIKGQYASVERREQGSWGWWTPLEERPAMHERIPPGPWSPVEHYGSTDVAEYFATLSQAMYGFSDFYPWNRNELWHHDPEGFRLIWEAWHHPKGFCRE